MVLVGTRNPLNIGAAARAMSNFGFFRLRVVNPYDVAFREARSAVGARDVLARAEQFPGIAEAVADCTLVVGTTAAHHRDIEHSLKLLQAGVRLIRKELRSAPVALLFGSEKRGLSTEDLSHCHWLMRIPTQPGHLSMNLGQAVAVCLYELSRDTRSAPEPRPVRATAAIVERVAASLFEVLRSSGYVKPGADASTQLKIRRLVGRLTLEAGDAELWLGMLRRILWKVRTG